MAYFEATIRILVDVDSEGEACDAISETLRELLKEFAANPNDTCFVDWKYQTSPEPVSGAGFEYAS